MSTRQTYALTITATSRHPEHLRDLVKAFKAIQSLCAIGHTATVSLHVDGDGPADLRFDYGDTDVASIEPPAEERGVTHIYVGY